ncbi:MAG: hypothetical protein K9K67_13420 [Bacteriovoracaceae bacterium]|nr:hypothetical protein [Bacteriovoracaceae bacterium]
MKFIQLSKKFQYIREVLIALTLLFGSPNLQAQGLSPLEALAGGLSKLAEGLTNINIESATLGVDKGVIAGAVLGIGRKVERNPFPTGKHDQFLVKDRMRLGYEIGAGFVLAGTVSYVQEWTLVYPVPSSLEGTLSRKFILDLFLPLRIKKIHESKLPQSYALIRESYFQGSGRIKAGGVAPLSVGNQFTYGKVFLNGLVTRKYKNGDLKVMREYSRFNKLAHELWLNIILFDLPIFDAYDKSGKLVRNYIVLKDKNLTPTLKEGLFKALFTGQNEEDLNDLFENEFVSRRVESDFKESYGGLSLFGIFTKETFLREDYVTETNYEEGSLKKETKETSWQYVDRHYHDWTSGVESLLFRSDVLLTGKTTLDKLGLIAKIEDPQILLSLIVEDSKTSQREYQSFYLPMFNDLRPSNMDPLPEVIPELKEKPESIFKVEAIFSESLLKKFQNTVIGDWYKALEKETGKPRVYWERAAEEGLHNRDRQRLRQARLPLREINLAKKLKTVGRYMEKAKRLKNSAPITSLRYMAWSLRKLFSVGQGAWDIRLLKVMKIVLGQEFWSRASIRTFSPTTEDKLDTMTTYEVSNPKLKGQLGKTYNFLLVDPSEIYHFFDEPSMKK